MKALLAGIFHSIALVLSVTAGEPGVTYTYQVLSGIAEGVPRMEKVYCYDRCATSGMPTAFGLIAAKNVPPTNVLEPIGDMNLTSASGITIRVLESKGRYEIVIDASGMRVPERFDVKPIELVKAVLEAIRRTAILVKVTDYQVTIRATDELKAASERQLKAFEAHSKEGPFSSP